MELTELKGRDAEPAEVQEQASKASAGLGRWGQRGRQEGHLGKTEGPAARGQLEIGDGGGSKLHTPGLKQGG